MKKGKRVLKHSKVLKDMETDSEGKSNALLDLEADSKNYSASSIESKLLVCKKDDFMLPTAAKHKSSLPNKKPSICAIPESPILGKVKDFLGVMSEANKQLLLDADNSDKYDIEAVTGNESEYIEMDLMLGVADLHTPEAVAAAESAIAGYQSTIPLAAISSDDESDNEENMSKAAGPNSSREAKRKKPSKKQPSILELS